MKKYILLSLQKELDCCRYHPTVDKISSALYYFLLEASPSYLTKTLDDKTSHGFGYDSTDLSWSHKNNSVTIEISGEAEEYNGIKYDLFIMKFDNFKKIVKDWADLKNKQTPEIYFIQEDDGTIVVRESLEIAD